MAETGVRRLGVRTPFGLTAPPPPPFFINLIDYYSLFSPHCRLHLVRRGDVHLGVDQARVIVSQEVALQVTQLLGQVVLLGLGLGLGLELGVGLGSGSGAR